MESAFGVDHGDFSKAAFPRIPGHLYKPLGSKPKPLPQLPGGRKPLPKKKVEKSYDFSIDKAAYRAPGKAVLRPLKGASAPKRKKMNAASQALYTKGVGVINRSTSPSNPLGWLSPNAPHRSF